MKWCESCLVAGEKVPAIGKSKNPEYSGYDLCEFCIDEYDSRCEGPQTLAEVFEGEKEERENG